MINALDTKNGTPLPMQDAAGSPHYGIMRPATRLARSGVGLAAVRCYQHRAAAIICATIVSHFWDTVNYRDTFWGRFRCGDC